VIKPLVLPAQSKNNAQEEIEEGELRLRQAKELNDWLDEIDNGDFEFP
jgi:hypothetical protein